MKIGRSDVVFTWFNG